MILNPLNFDYEEKVPKIHWIYWQCYPCQKAGEEERQVAMARPKLRPGRQAQDPRHQEDNEGQSRHPNHWQGMEIFEGPDFVEPKKHSRVEDPEGHAAFSPVWVLA